MNIEYLNDEFPLIIIDDVYNGEGLKNIWTELDFLCSPNRLKGPEKTYSATGKKNLGISLGDFYKDITNSDIHEASQTFTDYLLDIVQNHESWFFQDCYITKTSELVSYYEDGDYYAPHKDMYILTVLTWFFREPKVFTGGDLIFPKYDMTVELKNNRTVVFPSMVVHGVSEIKMEEKYKNQKLGRFCISQFLGH